MCHFIVTFHNNLGDELQWINDEDGVGKPDSEDYLSLVWFHFIIVPPLATQ